jgi:hypothetical protein
MIEVYASDQSLLRVGLERANADQEDDRAGITELLAAIDALTQGWLQPLGVGFQLVYCDPSQYFEEIGRPPVPHQFLRSARAPDDVHVRETFTNSAAEELPVLDAGSISRAIGRGLDQPAPPGAITTLSELKWTAVRARAPISDPIALQVTDIPVSTVSDIIDGQRWYYGPTSGTAGPPVRLHAINDHFATRIQLAVFWDMWIGHAAGRALLDLGIDRVLARPGWGRTA